MACRCIPCTLRWAAYCTQGVRKPVENLPGQGVLFDPDRPTDLANV